MPQKKLYAYVDESGATQARECFIVVVVLVDQGEREAVERALEEAERQSGKNLHKWNKSTPHVRSEYMRLIAATWRRFAALVCRLHVHGVGHYYERTGDTILGAVRSVSPPDGAEVVIVVDGLNAEERQRMTKQVRAARLPIRLKVRGGRDESTPLLRLADALAGLIRHHRMGHDYLTEAWESLRPWLREV